MPRPIKSRRHRGPISDRRRPRPTSPADPAAPLRALIQTGLVTAAALSASDDLAAAASSLDRLGSLTSGMWRALARELASAADRLDRQTQERLDSLQSQARALDVDPDAIIAAGMAAGHLEEHRDSLTSLLPTLEPEVNRLAASDVLLGFTVDEEDPFDDEHPQDEPNDAETRTSSAPGPDDASVQIRLFLWPAPLTPALVRVAPDLGKAILTDVDVESRVKADDGLQDALATTCGLPRERLLLTLSRLGLACWSAHRRDEDGDEDEAEDDVDADDD